MSHPIGKATLLLSTLALGLVLQPGVAAPQGNGPAPALVRDAAEASGLRSLAEVSVPEVDNLDHFLNRGRLANQAALVLGKALFWDMQVGSDGQACASCHFHAGADNRAKNQLSPGLRQEPMLDPRFGNTHLPHVMGVAKFGPNYTLAEDDFPFHVLKDSEENNFKLREVLRDTNDAVSSQGVFNSTFVGIRRGQPSDIGSAFPDDIFSVDGVNTRRVEPRNTPTVINAVFNHSNFWDGRAHNLFNGVSAIGPLDKDAQIWVDNGRKLVQKTVRIPNSSLASQAVEPPQATEEMSFIDRPFSDIARKLFSLRPLGLQDVHRHDSVLGPLSRARFGKKGVFVDYPTLIRLAFKPRYWAARQKIDGYSQMEQNFTLFFGLAIQLYESTLVSDRTPFDRFMEGDDAALTDDQLRGLLVFLNRGERGNDPAVDEAIAASGRVIGAGNCISCHGGPEFTDAAFSSLAEDGDKLELIEIEDTSVLQDGLLALGATTQGLLDNGFSNIGVRPSDEDLGRGGEANGLPLSLIDQLFTEPDLLEGVIEDDDLPCAPAISGDCPERRLVKGAFKIPGLRNVELTGPYFHNGGQATLSQVIEFYDRQSDFGDVNIDQLDRNIVFIDLDEPDEAPLVELLLAFTDPRVSNEEAPFDHPQLVVPNGHRGDESLGDCVDTKDGASQACDDRLEIPAVGKLGRSAEGLLPLETFLELEHVEEDEDE